MLKNSLDIAEDRIYEQVDKCWKNREVKKIENMKECVRVIVDQTRMSKICFIRIKSRENWGKAVFEEVVIDNVN